MGAYMGWSHAGHHARPKSEQASPIEDASSREMKRHSTQPAATLLSSLLFIMAAAGCTGSMYDWEVRTESTPIPGPFHPTNFAQHPVAIFPAITMPGLRGNEFTLGHYLGYILRKENPNWKVVLELETSSRISRKGLAPEFARMRNDYDQSSIFDADTLRKIGAAIDARYIFQPRLAAFSQTMIDRWMFPGLNVRLLQTRSSIMRISLQLWDADWLSHIGTIFSGPRWRKRRCRMKPSHKIRSTSTK